MMQRRRGCGPPPISRERPRTNGCYKSTLDLGPDKMPLRRAGSRLSQVAGKRSMTDTTADEDFFEIVNIYPADSGLPMVVWASERGHARHDVRIKVNQSHCTRMLPGNLATVAVRPTPRLIAGQLSPADLQAVSEWIRLNEAALVAHWNYQISGVELGRRLQRLPAGRGRAQRPRRERQRCIC